MSDTTESTTNLIYPNQNSEDKKSLLLDNIENLKKNYTDYFDNIYKTHCLYYESFGDQITGTMFESITNNIFKKTFNNDFVKFTDKNFTYDAMLFNNISFSFKGCESKYQKRKKKYVFSITQYRTTTYPLMEDKIKFINDACLSTTYELCCVRNFHSGEWRFIIFMFEKNIFSIDSNEKFIPTIDRIHKKSNNINYKLIKNDLVLFRINGSASEQFVIYISDLFKFIQTSKSIVLYNNFAII